MLSNATQAMAGTLFFGLVTIESGRDATEPNRLVVLLPGSAAFLAVGAATLGIGLLAAA